MADEPQISSELVVSYIMDTRVNRHPNYPNRMFEAGFFTRDLKESTENRVRYYARLSRGISFTQRDMNALIAGKALVKLVEDQPIRTGQKVWTNALGEYYIARMEKPEEDPNKKRIFLISDSVSERFKKP